MARFINPGTGDACFISAAYLADPPQEYIDNIAAVYVDPDGNRWISNGTQLVLLSGNNGNNFFEIDAILDISGFDSYIKPGLIIQALGYTNKNDNGGGLLLVKSSGVENLVTVFDIGNGLFVERVDFDSLTPQMAGCDQTGTIECTDNVQRLFDVSSNLKIPVIGIGGDFKITKKDTWSALQAKTNLNFTGKCRFFPESAFEGALVMYGNPSDGAIDNACIDGPEWDGLDIVSGYSISGVSEITAGVYLYACTNSHWNGISHHFLSDNVGTENGASNCSIGSDENFALIHHCGVSGQTQNGLNADGADNLFARARIWEVRSGNSGRGLRVHSLDNSNVSVEVYECDAVAVGVDGRNNVIRYNIHDNRNDAVWLLDDGVNPTSGNDLSGVIKANGYRGFTQLGNVARCFDNNIHNHEIEDSTLGGLLIAGRNYARKNKITQTGTVYSLQATGDNWEVEDNNTFGGGGYRMGGVGAIEKNNRSFDCNSGIAFWIRGLVSSLREGNIAINPSGIGHVYGPSSAAVNCVNNTRIGNGVIQTTSAPTYGFQDVDSQINNTDIGNWTTGTFSVAGASMVGVGPKIGNTWQTSLYGDFTWATKPLANLIPVGSRICVTDLNDSVWYSDGTYYHPLNGFYSFGKSGSIAAPLSTLTGVTAGQFTLSPLMLIPAGMLIPGISQVVVDAQYYRRGANATATASARFGTANNNTDSAMLGITMTAVDTQSLRFQWCGFVSATNVITVQTNTPVNTASVAGALVDRNTNINIAADQYASLLISGANAGDSFDLIGYRVTVVQ